MNHLVPLIYNGQLVTQRAEALSLTDMWKASGSPSGRGPSDWLALVSTKEFVSVVEATLEAGISGIQTKKGGRGIGGSTFAHWQIALAYAKYLDPQFHMLCNTWVRERMEGRAISFPADVVADLERTLGIMKSTIHKVTTIERAVERLEGANVAPTFDFAGSVTSDQMIDMAGVARTDRVKGTSCMVTAAMLDFCAGSGCQRTPADLNRSRPWRFQREKASEWLFGGQLGAERIRGQIARVHAKRASKKSQGSLVLVQSDRREGAQL